MNLIGMKRISRPPNGAILNEIIGIWYIHGFYLGTVVYGKNVLKGLQSVLFVRTVVRISGHEQIFCTYAAIKTPIQ